MRIAITGAAGFIGSHLAEALVGRGHEVTCLARSPRRLRWLKGLPVRVVYGNLDRVDSLIGLVRAQDVVIHTAGITKAPDMETFLRGNVTGTENVLAAVKECNPHLHRFVLISSQEAMGPSPNGAALSEEVERKPLSMYGKSKHLAELALRRFWDSIPMTVVRPPSVYGPRDRDIYAYFQLAALGINPILGYPVTLSVVYVKNLVSGIALAVERPMGSFRSYFFTDGPPVTMPAFSGMIAQAMEKKQIKVPVPKFAVRAVADVAGAYSRLTHRTVLLSKEKIQAMMQGYWILSDERARSELGYRPAYSTAQGIAETARWYRENKWL